MWSVEGRFVIIYVIIIYSLAIALLSTDLCLFAGFNQTKRYSFIVCAYVQSVVHSHCCPGFFHSALHHTDTYLSLKLV